MQFRVFNINGARTKASDLAAIRQLTDAVLGDALSGGVRDAALVANTVATN